MMNKTKYIILIFFGALTFNALAQKKFFTDSIPEIFWNTSTYNYYEQAKTNQTIDLFFLWDFSINNVIVENLKGYDSIIVIEAFGKFLNSRDSIIEYWTPTYPLNPENIQHQAQVISKKTGIDSLWLRLYAVGVRFDNKSFKLDSVPKLFTAQRDNKNRILNIASTNRSVTYIYSINGRLKEIRFNHPDNPNNCPDAQGDEDCCCCCEGEPRKIVLKYKKGQLIFFTKYIYYAGDGQYYNYFLKYY